MKIENTRGGEQTNIISYQGAGDSLASVKTKQLEGKRNERLPAPSEIQLSR